MGLVPASYKVTARSVSRVLGDGRRQSDRSLKGHEAGVRKGQPWALNHHPGIVAVYGLNGAEARGHALKCPDWIYRHDELEIPPGAIPSAESPHPR